MSIPLRAKVAVWRRDAGGRAEGRCALGCGQAIGCHRSQS